MQQSVLITACRGPDGLPKNHVSKKLLRWLRRCFLLSAFDKAAIKNPGYPKGGSFTGPSCPGCEEGDNGRACDIDTHCIVDICHHMRDLTAAYLKCVDEVPHHFHLHLMHAAEILGYKHPDPQVRAFWFKFYCDIVFDAHLNIETPTAMDRRLGDHEAQWREGESVTAD